jgi:hypothetical protein
MSSRLPHAATVIHEMDDVGLATRGSDTSVTYRAMKEDDRRVDSLDHFMKSTDEPLPQVALEMRIVAHDKMSRGCFIVARATPGASGRGFNSVAGSIARLQHDQACSRPAGLPASPGSTGQARGW